MRFKFAFSIALLSLQNLYATHPNIDKYFQYLSSPNFGQMGDHTRGEMEIVDCYDAIVEIQKKYYNEFIQKGFCDAEAEKYSHVGVVNEDRYWIWLRDPLILPNGKTTAYNRFIPRHQLNGMSTVVAMAISEKGEILVNIGFRHATREWELELPRGGREKNETAEEAALRELEEETGMRGTNAMKIASIPSDSGISSCMFDLFVVKNLVFTQSNKEECEAISDTVFLSKQVLKQAFIDGWIEMKINGQSIKIFCRDPFLATALLIVEAKSW